MRKLMTLVIIGMFSLLLLGLCNVNKAEAISGSPNSPSFGYGVQLDPQGSQIEISFRTAALSGMDWIAMPFNWAEAAPNSESITFASLDYSMQVASTQKVNVMISIQMAPAWCLTPQGPDHSAVKALVQQLMLRYPGSLRAIELFPAANTVAGWGVMPNPADYLQLFNTVKNTIGENQSILLVVGGLSPKQSTSPSSDWQDTEFLSSLYQLGIAQSMPIIGMRLPSLSEDLIEEPHGNGSQIRHVEIIRQVMVSNGHEHGLIWITGFSWPISLPDSQAQSRWLTDAYGMLQSRLYLGAAFFNSINPSSKNTGSTLISPDGGIHPVINQLGQLIASHTSSPSLGYQNKTFLRTDFKR